MSEASKSVPARGLQIGADFGPGHTGVALLDGGNAVLAREVLAHRTDVSDSLKSRRESRALRRRAKSRKARLRNFRALLAEMGIPPRPDRPPEFVGNRLYALAHRRGWDYSTLEEILADESGDQPRETETVRLADDLLKEKVPPQRLEALDGPARSPEIRKKQEEAAEILKAGKRPEGLFRHVKLRETCLGEFAALLRAAREAEDGDDEDAAAQNREAAERLREKLRTLKGVPEWLDERLDIVFGGEAPAEIRAEMRGHILALLGLENRRAAFESGIDYRPHNSRRRGKALEELEETLKDNGLGEWLPRARAVLNRQLRKKRFKNRAPGKCVACGLNLPLRVKVRRLLFEIEALQMRVRPDGEAPNLRPEEAAELLRLVNFRKGKIRDREKWAEFFARFPKPPRKTDDEDDEPRTKPAQLRAVAEGPMEGRVPGLCRNCLMKKAALLKIPRDDRGGEWREKWNALSGERVLGLQDAAPSLRQKVERVCARVARMLKDAGFPNPREAPVARIGVERAAFDIVAASSASGRRPKKSEYGKKRRHGPAELLRRQGGLCIYCGTPPGANLTVDHFVPRASGGGDSHKNRLAACMACNIQKGNLGGIQFAPDALAALRENDPDKAGHLEKNKGKLSADNLSAPQQTMLGVKILRGELARLVFGETALAADKKKFPVIRARDAAALRRFWFPQIARKKAALRAENSDNALVVRPGEKPKRVSGKIDPAQDRPEFVREESGKIVIAPREGQDHEGVYNLQLEEVREWKIPSGRPLEINLKEKKIRGRLAAVNGKDPAAPGLPVQWEIQDRILTLRARTRTVARLVFIRRLRIVVPPKKDAPVRKYHHAVDAVVVAADKKWDQIVRLARDPDRRTARAKKLLNASGRPKGPLAADAVPPDDSEPWLVEDKPDKSGPKRPRFKANPVRRARAHRFPKGGGEARETAEFTRRVPLDKLGRKRIPAIPDSAAAIREALAAAWREIDQMPPEERQNSVAKIPGGDEAIAAAWLLKRPPGHFLHHKRVRSAPVKVSPRTALSPPPNRRRTRAHPPLLVRVAALVRNRRLGGKKSEGKNRPQNLPPPPRLLPSRLPVPAQAQAAPARGRPARMGKRTAAAKRPAPPPRNENPNPRRTRTLANRRTGGPARPGFPRRRRSPPIRRNRPGNRPSRQPPLDRAKSPPPRPPRTLARRRPARADRTGAGRLRSQSRRAGRARSRQLQAPDPGGPGGRPARGPSDSPNRNHRPARNLANGEKRRKGKSHRRPAGRQCPPRRPKREKTRQLRRLASGQPVIFRRKITRRGLTFQVNPAPLEFSTGKRGECKT